MKNVLILGDSYSTYEGWIPKGYAVYYSPDGIEGGHEVTKMKLEDTWWQKVLRETGDRLLLNNSWSGSTIGYTGYNGSDCSESSSFIYRFRRLKGEGFFEVNRVDKVFVFGGTNDSWSNAPLGELMLEGWEEQDLYCVLPAIGCLMSEMKQALPDAEIYFLINTDIKDEIRNCIKSAGEFFGIPTIVLSEIAKEHGHPTVEGMDAISRQVLKKGSEI